MFLRCFSSMIHPTRPAFFWLSLCLFFAISSLSSFLPPSSLSLSLLAFLSLLISTFVKPTLQSLSLNLSLCVSLRVSSSLFPSPPSPHLWRSVGLSDFIFLNWCLGVSTNVSVRMPLVVRSLLSVCLSASLTVCRARLCVALSPRTFPSLCLHPCLYPSSPSLRY